MKIILLISIAVLLTIPGCENVVSEVEETTPAEELAAITALKAYTAESPSQVTKNLVERPYKLKNVSGIIRIIAPSDACENAEVRIEGSGQGTHVGRFDVVNRYCTDMQGNPIPPISGTVTAANGDLIYVILTGSNTDAMGISTLDYVIVGGNGRFEGAGGRYTLQGIVDYDNLQWALEGEGMIIF